MMVIKVIQLTSHSHHENILASLHQLKLQGQLCDVTVRVDYQGDVQEFQVHQVILAASSGYFKSILLSQDPAQDKLLLSNMHSHVFTKFLDFAYTGKVEIARDKIADVQAMAQFLECGDLTKICVEALSAGILNQKSTRKTSASKVETLNDLSGAEEGEKTKGRTRAKSLFLKRKLSPHSSEKEVLKKRCKPKSTQKNEKRVVRKLKLKVSGPKVLPRNWYSQQQAVHSENQVDNVSSEECEDRTENDPQLEDERDKETETSLEKPSSDVDNWEYEADEQCDDLQDPLFLLEEEEGEQKEDGQSDEKLKRTSKAQFQCDKCQRTFHYERSYLKHIR